jgi:hypothetical protein
MIFWRQVFSMSRPIMSIESKGDFKYVDGFFKRTKKANFKKYIDYYGQLGCMALAMETPVDTSETALSWNYEVVEDDGSLTLYFTNDSMAGRVPVVILICYGHATRNGGYVQPYNFVSPVTKEIFEEIANSIWREVTQK